MTYLDHAATTPLLPSVVETMNHVMLNVFGNPSSIHQYGRKAHEYLENARQVVADSLHVAPHEIIFTSGGTESDNTAIIGVAMSQKAKGNHIITTIIEHSAVLKPMIYLEEQGFEVTYLSVDEKGQITPDQVKQALRPDTILVSIMAANNETGNLLPIPEIGELLLDHQAIFHTDAVQLFGKSPIFPNEWHIDLLSASGHKLNGPRGVGILYKSDHIRLPSLLLGGDQEEKRRAGTENLAAICGTATAIQTLTVDQQAKNQQIYGAFIKKIVSGLTTAGINFQVNGEPEHKLTNILNIHLIGVPSELLLMNLDLQGFAVSTGSACTAGNIEPSHVLEAMFGKTASAIKESIRISFGYGVNDQQIDTFVETLVKTIKRLKRD